MSAVGDIPGRVRDVFTTAGREMGRFLRRSTERVAVTVEERPDVGPLQAELPYPLPTRGEPLALALFYGAGLTLVVSLTLVATSYILMGHVPPGLTTALAAIAVVLGVTGNLTVIARPVERNATQTVRPMVTAGIPVLNAMHYWFNPVVTVLAIVYVLVQPVNNWLIPAAAMVMLAWAVTGLLLKLPPDSPWNGPMLERWAGTLHKRPFIYIALLVLVLVGSLSELVH
jgi:hypothetical protein